MTILEERSAAAALRERDGRRNFLLFDDIGCLLDSERSNGLGVNDRFVHDYTTGVWLRGSTAVFLASEELKARTPMASGFAAFADSSCAGNAQHQFGGDVCDFSSLAELRKRQMARHKVQRGD